MGVRAAAGTHEGTAKRRRLCPTWVFRQQELVPTAAHDVSTVGDRHARRPADMHQVMRRRRVTDDAVQQRTLPTLGGSSTPCLPCGLPLHAVVRRCTCVEGLRTHVLCVPTGDPSYSCATPVAPCLPRPHSVRGHTQQGNGHATTRGAGLASPVVCRPFWLVVQPPELPAPCHNHARQNGWGSGGPWPRRSRTRAGEVGRAVWLCLWLLHWRRHQQRQQHDEPVEQPTPVESPELER